MPIKLDCPRCRRPLSVPSKLTGSYAKCPHCDGSFWVSEDPAASQPQAGSTIMPPTPPPGVAAPPQSDSTQQSPQQQATQQPASKQAVSKQPPPPPSAPTPPAESTSSSKWSQPQVSPSPGQTAPGQPSAQQTPASRKARFIAAEAAQSTLELAEGGQLPELHYRDSDERKKKKQVDRSQTTSTNPIVLFGVIGLSLMLSVLIMMDSPTQSSANKSVKDRARMSIENEFFGQMDDSENLKQYQVYLRAAKRAHSRRDYRTEREMYTRVLNMLREERRFEDDQWLTGGRVLDETLEEKITTILGD